MKAGFSRLEITPPLGTNLAGYFHERPANGIISQLYVNTITIDDGETKAALITLDLEGMNRDNNTFLREKISALTGIDAEAIFIHCIHTHQGPVNGTYNDPEKCSPFDGFLISRVCDSVVFALQDMEKSGEAKMFVASGKAEGISFVRLFKLKNGKYQMHPNAKDPECAGPAGEPDETLQLIKITREGASDIAIAHFATHPDVVGHKVICHDWPGYVREFTEKILTDAANGKGVHAVCFNGAQGDVAHVDFEHLENRHDGIDHSKHMARVIVGEILKIYTYAEEVDCSKIAYKQIPVNLPTNKADEKNLEMSRKVKALQDVGGYKVVSAAVKAGILDYEIYEASKNLWLEFWPDEKDVYVSALAIGDICFVGFPGEPFTQIGVQTKAGSPYKMTLPCCYGNGGEGYFPMKDIYTGGAYEATTARFKMGSAEKLTEEAIKLINDLHSK